MAPDLDDDLIRAEAEAALRLHRNGRRDEALSRAMDLAIQHKRSSPLALNLSGDLNMAAHRRNRRRGRGAAADDKALAERQAKFAATCYKMSLDAVPDCVETFAAYGEALVGTGMWKPAWDAFMRAAAIAHPADPAAHRLGGYGRSAGLTRGERVEMAKARLRRAIDCYSNARCEDAVAEVLATVEHHGAASAVHGAAKLADRYPSSARAQCLPAYVAVELARERRGGAAYPATAATPRHKTLRRALATMDTAARTFDRSLVVALFRAKLLACLHDYDAAEAECRRALAVDNPDDPAAHEIPLGSAIGEEYDDMVSSLRKQLCDLQKKLVLLAVHDWASMESEKQSQILSVSIDELREHYSKIDQIAANTVSEARRFSKAHGSWCFWICPRSSGQCAGKKFLDTASLLEHLRNKHPDDLWVNLKSFLDTKLCGKFKTENASQDGYSCHDEVLQFQSIDGMIELVLNLPPGGMKSETLSEMRRRKCSELAEILDRIKKKLRACPKDLSSSEFDQVRSEMQDLWLKFTELSVFDYREAVVPLARMYQWKELKKRISEDGSIIAAWSIDDIFGDVPDASEEKNVSAEHASLDEKVGHQTGENKVTNKSDNLKA
ncbi:hypothetical protein OsI_36014 [Oryza sativa Indica Group]|uniref:DUF629 domain-containing protein n=1 Tax=Oryza sativa subsp. indica TaxID=39946 RepID=B8BKC5_ORYSI|nr:hypothetical protein OsI_36014 [Oryza sativa Indica Group]